MNTIQRQKLILRDLCGFEEVPQGWSSPPLGQVNRSLGGTDGVPEGSDSPPLRQFIGTSQAPTRVPEGIGKGASGLRSTTPKAGEPEPQGFDEPPLRHRRGCLRASMNHLRRCDSIPCRPSLITDLRVVPPSAANPRSVRSSLTAALKMPKELANSISWTRGQMKR
jgi:hypothetical protein